MNAKKYNPVFDSYLYRDLAIDTEERIEAAYKLGKEADIFFTPMTQKQGLAFEAGLSDWLNSMGIEGVKAADISDQVTLKAFVYTLVGEGVVSYGRYQRVPYTKEYVKKYIKEIQACFDSTIKRFPEAKNVREWKSNFERGIQIANKYLSGYDIFCSTNAYTLYKLDISSMREAGKLRYFKIHQDIDERVVSKVREKGSIDREIFEIGLDLYNEKHRELYTCLANGELESALALCDYLSLLVSYYEGIEWSLRNTISRGRERLELIGDTESSASDELDIREEALDGYTILNKAGETQRLRENVIDRMENPLRNLQQRLQACVASEDYEKAAELRDLLAKEQEETKRACAGLGDIFSIGF